LGQLHCEVSSLDRNTPDPYGKDGTS